MKTITVNLNLSAIPINIEPETEIPCPRANFWTTGVQTTAFFTLPGSYSETLTVEDTSIVGVDVFTWRNYIVDVAGLNNTENVIITTESAGWNGDQNKTSIKFLSEGVYSVDINIEEII